MLERLCASPVVIMNGTFLVSPLLFSQLYTLHGEFRGAIFPVMYVPLPEKTRETYEAVVSLIVQEANRINCEFIPDTFLLDFELAMMSAIRSVFPSSRIQGCYFHFTQALWRNCLRIRLKRFYQNPLTKMFVRSIMALPSVSLDKIQRALDIIMSKRLLVLHLLMTC